MSGSDDEFGQYWNELNDLIVFSHGMPRLPLFT